MEVISALERFKPPAEGTVVSIGNFDGVHLGHARLIARAHEVAQRLTASVVAITFHPHPLLVLAPERAPTMLTTLREKLSLLERLNVHHCIVLPAVTPLLSQEADDFLASLIAHVRPRALVEGPDFTFGRGRRGTLDTLRQHADHWGYEVHEVGVFRCKALPTHPAINSTSIRQALRDGRVDEANAMLGRPYRVVGTVGHGEGRGAGLGFPTANLEGIVQHLPQQAVYAAAAQLASGEFRLTAVNIGPQPTFDQDASRVEAHILDLHDHLRGERVGLHFFRRLREQSRFPNAEALVAQLHRDVEQTRAFAAQLDELKAECAIPL